MVRRRGHYKLPSCCMDSGLYFNDQNMDYFDQKSCTIWHILNGSVGWWVKKHFIVYNPFKKPFLSTVVCHALCLCCSWAHWPSFHFQEYGACSGHWPPPKCCFPLSSQLPVLSVWSGLSSALTSNRFFLILSLWCQVTAAFPFLSLIIYS